MSLLASAADFEQGGLYNPPYHEYPFFQARVDSLIGRAAPNGQKLAIWGCGYGYFVQLAVTAGYDAFGFDASAYAITTGKAALPGIAARLFQRDALVAADVTGAKSDAGIHGKANFALLVTEDVLPCMSDAEVSTCVPLLRGICSSNLLHIVTPSDYAWPGSNPDPRLNWKTDAEWKALLSPPDVVYDAVTDAVV